MDLDCHLDYSPLGGACDIPRPIRVVAETGMPGVALTDHRNLFGAVQWHNAKGQPKGGPARFPAPLFGCKVPSRCRGWGGIGLVAEPPRFRRV